VVAVLAIGPRGCDENPERLTACSASVGLGGIGCVLKGRFTSGCVAAWQELAGLESSP